jgi:hypothetical protein
MKCSKEDIIRYFFKETDEEESAKISEHLEKCSECKKFYDLLFLINEIKPEGVIKKSTENKILIYSKNIFNPQRNLFYRIFYTFSLSFVVAMIFLLPYGGQRINSDPSGKIENLENQIKYLEYDMKFLDFDNF